MTCEDVLATMEKGYWGTTVAERNAACVHCRGCTDCQKMLVEKVRQIPLDNIVQHSALAAMAWAQDRSDPEWE